jgi:hypothetical protein
MLEIVVYPPEEHESATNDGGKRDAEPDATAMLLVDDHCQDGEDEGSDTDTGKDRCGERCHGRTPPNSCSCVPQAGDASLEPRSLEVAVDPVARFAEHDCLLPRGRRNAPLRYKAMTIS